MIHLDPRDLINVPGAGRAEVALRAAGLWDEELAEGATLWEVCLFDRSRPTAAGICTVMAVSAEAAIDAAWCRNAKGGVDWLYHSVGPDDDVKSQAIMLEDDL